MSDMMLDSVCAASRRLVREMDMISTAKTFMGLSPYVVRNLNEIGNYHEITSAALSDTLGLDKSSASRMVRKYLSAGLLCQAGSGKDKRARPICLSTKSRRALASINAYTRSQMAGALKKLSAGDQIRVRNGLSLCAAALQAHRINRVSAAIPASNIVFGYRPGALGRIVALHADYYARAFNFGAFFESRMANDIAAFVNRLTHPRNGLWLALESGDVIGAIAIDSQDLTSGRAHLRWFIVADGRRGFGIGRQLLAAALTFCDRMGFAETELWTYRGLEAARRLYEEAGYVLVKECVNWQGGQEMLEQCYIRSIAPLATNVAK
ncbi:helix-turn-helix domain-containing GNAT family N-acetyltransferase [Martelella alba]|uniref:MarR family transcriptional regulator n=1 Tax=Martelella alba TaxID=2590451 RepID=A0ABY2SKN0_9HYPH|nr:helix-turn-helix domain-containing GNAT family N-acetyltransferase [Martelella alba]TKI06129.1 MarR family transcriptional regulator [Martelella alba]